MFPPIGSAPKKVHRFVEALVAKIGASESPIWIPVRPTPTARPNECFLNVSDQVATAGGEVGVGWAIWELPGLFIEAELHAIWMSPHLGPIDVTPKPIEIDRILFIPDTRQSFDEKSRERLDNVRLPESSSQAVSEFIEHCKALHRFLEEGTDSENPRLMHLDAHKHEWFMSKKAELLLKMVSMPIGRNDICRCGSSNKFKKCCGR